MRLYEQSLQRCSIGIFSFEDNDDWVPGSESAEAERKAGEFMKDLAIAFVEGKIERNDLYAERDRRAKQMGLRLRVPAGKDIP